MKGYKMKEKKSMIIGLIAVLVLFTVTGCKESKYITVLRNRPTVSSPFLGQL